MDKKQIALNSLIQLAQKQGYLLFDDMTNIGEEHNLSIQDATWVSNAVAARGIAVYDNAPENLKDAFIKILSEESNKSISMEPVAGQVNSPARKEFLAWVERRFTSQKRTAKQTIEILDIINMRCRKTKLLENELYEITNVGKIERLTEEIVLNPSRIGINSRGMAYAFYCALETYHKFLQKGSGDGIEDRFLAFLDERRAEYIDNRSMGGSFWIIGGYEVEELINECKVKFKLRFHYNPTPKAKSMRGKTGWWTTDLPKL